MDREHDDRLSELLAEIRDLIPHEGGRIEIEDEPDQVEIVGDEVGLLRLGIEIAHQSGASEHDRSIRANLLRQNHPPVVVRRVTDWEEREGHPGLRAQARDSGWLGHADGAGLLALACAA